MLTNQLVNTNIKFDDAFKQYMVSKVLTDHSVKKVELPENLCNRYPRQNLQCILPKYEEAGEKLRETLKLQEEKRILLDNQWILLREREKSLKNEFESFAGFIKENGIKRDRADRRIKDFNALIQSRQDNTINMQNKYDRLLKTKETMEELIAEYHIFPDFLKRIVDTYTEFSDINDILQKFFTLRDAKDKVSEYLVKKTFEIEESKEEMLKLIRQKENDILGLKTCIAELEVQLDTTKHKSHTCEQVVNRIHRNILKTWNDIESVRECIWATYKLMMESRNAPIAIQKDNFEQQLFTIKKTLVGLKKIIKIKQSLQE